MTGRCRAVLVVAAALLGACGEAAPPVTLRRLPVPELRAHGLSGVATGGDHVWAVAEERRELHRFDRSWTPGSRARLPIEGVAAPLELESAAWLGDGLLALGTETEEVRDTDAVLLVKVGARAQVVGATTVDWQALFHHTAAPNRGIEGLCAGGHTLLAAGEWVLDDGGERIAPLVRAAHAGGAVGPWEPLRLRLTSDVGKISALDCDEAPGAGLVVHAVERHFGVTRILRFEVPAAAGGAVLVPTIVSDVTSMASDLPNVEGLVARDGLLWMVSDHDRDDVEGTTELLTLSPLGGPLARPPGRLFPAGIRSSW